MSLDFSFFDFFFCDVFNELLGFKVLLLFPGSLARSLSEDLMPIKFDLVASLSFRLPDDMDSFDVLTVGVLKTFLNSESMLYLFKSLVYLSELWTRMNSFDF